MSEKSQLIDTDATNKREVVKWIDPLKRICSCFARSPAPQVSFHELMKKGPKDKAYLKKNIIRMLKELHRSPIDEVELLLILLAAQKTGDVVKIKWRMTEKGQAAKDMYKHAKESFLRNGVIDEA